MNPYAVEIVKTLRSAGYEALLAGGCVRDRIMGREPLDYDIATSAPPDVVQELFPANIATGKSFGVIRVITTGGEFEVATFRVDGPYVDGRRPLHVRFSTPEEDVRRRDFTINGLLYDPIQDKVLDFVGGVEDIGRRVIRTIGDPMERFSEDKLRMIRAVRFACQLQFQIDSDTLSVISSMAHEILMVSWERIRDELLKILTSQSPGRGIELLEETGLLRHILPEVSAMKGVAQPDNLHPEGDVFTHTVAALNELSELQLGEGLQGAEAESRQAPVPTPFMVSSTGVSFLSPLDDSANRSSLDSKTILAVATLLHDVAKPVTIVRDDRIRFPRHESKGAEMATAICQRLRLSTKETETISWLVSKHMVLKDVRKMRTATLKKLVRDSRFSLLQGLFYVDRMASNRDMDDLEYLQRMVRQFSADNLKPPRLITGHDLIALGLSPGPVFSEILTAIEEEQLEGKISTKEEALSLAREIASHRTSYRSGCSAK